MKKYTSILLFLSLSVIYATAQHRTIDISGNNTLSDYISYSTAISLPQGDTVDVKMARYCYFSSTITGRGTLFLYAGGERCYLGTAKGATWPDWTKYTGDVHVKPFPANSSSAGFYGVVMAHGGKSFSPENIEEAVRSGKVNKSMENNRLILHDGATLCCEANTNGAGFRIGELQAEPGSSIIGYMKKNTRAAYFLVGCTNTDATLAGTIAPPSNSDTHPVGIIKEGTGTYRITGNRNYLTGALRVLNGRVLVMNDPTEAEQQHLSGALGAKPANTEAIAYVFEQGVLGGTGSIGGTVDNYGTVEPGDDAVGTLTIRNYATPSREAHLFLRPASVLRFKIGANGTCDQLTVGGTVRYYTMKQDFSVSDEMPVIEIVPDSALTKEGTTLSVGDEFTLLTAKSKTGDWHFDLRQPGRYTWAVEERTADDGQYSVVLRLVSLKDSDNNDNPDDPDNPESTMGAFYDDGIDDKADQTSLRTYAQSVGKRIGTALSTWKNDVTNENLAETREIGTQFSMLVAENEMKFDALEPSPGQFSFGGADNLVNFARRHQMTVRGHCLVWHQQLPEWVSSDGKKNDKNWSRAEALQILQRHITQVLTHFKGKVAEWDVVNECLDDDQTTVRTNPDSYDLRQNVWLRAIGEDYIDSAFVYARRADPSIRLYLNDYGVEQQGTAKATAFYNLAMRLQRDGIPVDGVGLQCHFSNGDVDSVKLATTFSRFDQAGMKCIITELDMGTPSTSDADLEEQARNYRVITDIMLNNENCPHMVIWGFKDNNSWRSGSNPLLYTSGMAKKPAWYAVRSALRHRDLITTVRMPSADDRPHTQAVYDLSGRRVSVSPTFLQERLLSPGIYIINGKKIIIK